MPENTPAFDAAPSLPSRIINIHAVDLTEGNPRAGETVTFTLPGDLRVPADGVTIAAGKRVVTLDAEGKGSIRLPVYSSAARADSFDGSWVILVSRSWSKQVDAIRVPEGATALSLSSIEPVRELDPAFSAWLITGVGAVIEEGPQWGARAELRDGVLTIILTVPAGSSPYWRGLLTSANDISALGSGLYGVGSPQTAADLGLPVISPGFIDVQSMAGVGESATSWSTQVFTALSGNGVSRVFRRSRYLNQNFGAWEESQEYVREFLTSESVLEALRTGLYTIGNPQTAADLGLPVISPGFIDVESSAGYSTSNTSWSTQVFTALSGNGVSRVFRRSRYLNQNFGAWQENRGGGASIDPTERTRFVQAQRYTPAAGGPGVIFRFDDGYLNNLEVAAPIMAEHGFRGTLYTGTHPSEWLGTTQNGAPICTPAQLLQLYEDYGWEIGSHTRTHERWDHAIGPGGIGSGEWWKRIRQGIKDFEAIGLPRPKSFAYPNGHRDTRSDSILYRDFQHLGMVGRAEDVPMPHNEPNFMTGWCEIETGANQVECMVRVKRYLESNLERGLNSVLAFHGVSAGGPPAPFIWWQDEQTFREITEFVADLGVPVITQAETPSHNLISDPSFWDQAPHQGAKFHSYPWLSDSPDWQRVDRADVDGYAMRLSGAGSDAALSQRVPVSPGEKYRLYLDARTISRAAGAVSVSVEWSPPLFSFVGGQPHVPVISMLQDVIEVSPGTASSWATLSTEIEVPEDSRIRSALIKIHGTGFSGACELGHVAFYPASYYDPLLEGVYS